MKFNIFKSIRESRTSKCIAVFLSLSMLNLFAFPKHALALTSGPGQQEFTSFEPFDTSQMVDLYTGDFTYNIPLLTVPGPNGGYPVNLAYHSGVGMDEEASWVGLGWNINVGAINRQLRGLPDDFNNEKVTQKMHLKDDVTVGLDLGGEKDESFGSPTGSEKFFQGAQLYYNTNKGLGYRLFANLESDRTKTFSAGVGISVDSQNGIGLEPDLSLKGVFNIGVNASYNSRKGIQDFGYSTGFNLNRLVNKVMKIGAKMQGNKYTGWGFGKHINASSAISFSNSLPVSGVSIPMKTNTYPFDISWGTAFYGEYWSSFPKFWKGYVSYSRVANDGVVNNNSYGYLYNKNSTISEDLLDFQRDNLPYSKKIPNLPSSSFTYDLYVQTGQGTGCMFRPYSSDVTLLHDPKKTNSDVSNRLNLEFGKGVSSSLHVGFGYTNSSGHYNTGDWESNNQIKGALTPNTSLDYENVYFKVFGENTGELLDPNQHDYLEEYWGGDKAIRANLSKSPNWLDRQFIAENNFVDVTGSTTTNYTLSSQSQTKKQRQKRSTNIEYFTTGQAQVYGFSKDLQYDDFTDPNNPTGIHKTKDFQSPLSQISEISVLQPDGMRYIYGLPAYNKTQLDATFSVDGQSDDDPTLAEVPSQNQVIDPIGIQDQYLNQTELPAYAHSWLLSYVVSSDYVDVNGNGPDNADYGYWVKFNYKKTSDAYQWRVPYEKSNYIEGNKNDPQDDKGVLSYGTKELYYLESIETKTHIAVFTTSPREDAVMANDLIAGGISTNLTNNKKMYKLDKISLYAKSDYYLTGSTVNTSAIPIKTVNFKYTYDLCGNVPNNTGIPTYEVGSNVDINQNRGKLTLSSVYFTYKNSNRGSLSPYTFDYGTRDANGALIPTNIDNPDYKKINIDRWGYYKPNTTNYTGNNTYPYVDFPYTEQNSQYGGWGTTPADEKGPKVDVWLLKKISLPTGGDINIEYESNDYAYVENQPATQMFDIVSLGSAPISTTPAPRSGPDQNNIAEAKPDGNNECKVYFRLRKPYVDSDPNSETDEQNFIKKYYLKNLTKIYFKTFTNLKVAAANAYDYVSGYADVYSDAEKCGIENNYGYITLKSVPLSKVNLSGTLVHPFRRAAFEHLRANRPELVYYASQTTSTAWDAQIENLFLSWLSLSSDLAKSIAGFNRYCNTLGFAKNIYLNGNSIIKLCNPDGCKYGGGTRVKKLYVSDNWIDRSDDPTTTPDEKRVNNSDYGQEYNYKITENGQEISSGVAYEPVIGDEESALTSPAEYAESTLLGSTQHLFVENPIMKSYYPGASVGYRKVTVTSIGPDKANADDQNNKLTYTRAPLMIYEFYTPKEFPVSFDQTDMSNDPAITRVIPIPGIYSSFKKRKARSQGYSIVLNDMAGKLKSVTQQAYKVNDDGSFSTDGQLISKKEYKYQTKDVYSDNKANLLSSKVKVLLSDGTFDYATMGQDQDIFTDFNENIQTSKGFGMDVNVDFFMIPFEPPLPLLTVVPIPYISDYETSLRTVVTNKIITRTGILKEVITTTGESVIKTENLAYDIETGEPLLTKVTNEFNDPVYNYTYPAHWYYDNMGCAYKNWGFTTCSFTDNVNITNGFIKLTNIAESMFTVGDEIILNYKDISAPLTHGYLLGTVVCIGNSIDHGVRCIDENGASITLPANKEMVSLEIYRSGRKNLQSLSAGSIIAKEINFDENSKTYTTPSKVIDASAIKYSDIWENLCVGCSGEYSPSVPFAIGNTVNPYKIGLRGIWRPEKSYVFDTTRTQNNDIQADGIYTYFHPFSWSDPSNKDRRWVEKNTITKYSPFGFELENKDAIGNYSSALYGYDNSVVTAIASNSKFKEMIFEDFETGDFCSKDINAHWGNGNPTGSFSISSVEAHTGKKSLYVGAGLTVAQPIVLNNKDCETVKAALQEDERNNVCSTGEYVVDTCDCAGTFSPIRGEKYVASVWTKQKEHQTTKEYNSLFTYEDPKVIFTFFSDAACTVPISNSTVTLTTTSTDKIIDGWQRIYGEFTVPSSTKGMTISFSNDNSIVSNQDVYFDDFRIHPSRGNMVSYVYDVSSLKLKAELDANNYATSYIYDDEGSLTKILKETEAGIKTIKEGRITNKE